MLLGCHFLARSAHLSITVTPTESPFCTQQLCTASAASAALFLPPESCRHLKSVAAVHRLPSGIYKTGRSCPLSGTRYLLESSVLMRLPPADCTAMAVVLFSDVAPAAGWRRRTGGHVRRAAIGARFPRVSVHGTHGTAYA
uniref:Uncharacterized protein n=1 Tax=Arundo donax TaxID=35708 RepID=A0A0A8ZVZ0_ARUDO